VKHLVLSSVIVNTFELKKWDDGGRHCTFYTVQWDGTEDSETDKFFIRYEDTTALHHEEANKLLRLLSRSIGDKYGATDDFFNRQENQAQALPPKPTARVPEIVVLGTNFPLRLYCYRISEKLVVLFNGGLKEASTAQGSPDLSMKFYEAQQFTRKIEQAFREEMIIVSEDGRVLTDFSGNEEIIL